jgi:transcriptional regulator with XRE-family HTH domain
MTQLELAKKAGIPQPSLSRILSGKHTTQIETIEKIAAALNTSVGIYGMIKFLQNVNIGTRNTIEIKNSFQKN